MYVLSWKSRDTTTKSDEGVQKTVRSLLEIFQSVSQKKVLNINMTGKTSGLTKFTLY